MKPALSPSPSGAATHLPDEPEYELTQQTSGPRPECIWVRPSGMPTAIQRTASGRMTMAPRALLERDPALQPGYLSSRSFAVSIEPMGTLGTELGEPVFRSASEESDRVSCHSFLRMRPPAQPLAPEAAAGAAAAEAVQPLPAAPDLGLYNVATWANLLTQAEHRTCEALREWTAVSSAMRELLRAGQFPADNAALLQRALQVQAATVDLTALGQLAWEIWQEWLRQSAQERQVADRVQAPGAGAVAQPEPPAREGPAGAEPAAVSLEHYVGEPPLLMACCFPPALNRQAAKWAERTAIAQEELLASVRACEAAMPDWQAACHVADRTVVEARTAWSAWSRWAAQSVHEVLAATESSSSLPWRQDPWVRACQDMRRALAAVPGRPSVGAGDDGPDEPASILPALPFQCAAAGYRQVPVVLPQPASPRAEADPAEEFELLRHPELAGIPLNDVLGKFCPPGSAAAQLDWSVPGLFVNSLGNDVAGDVAHLLMRAFSTAERQPAPASGMRAGGEALSLMQSLQALAERLSTSKEDRCWLADLVTDTNAACDSRVGAGLGVLLLAGRLQDLHRPGTPPAQGLHTLLLYAATREVEARISDLLGQQAEPSAELLLTGFHHVQRLLQQEHRVPVPSVFPENILHDPADVAHMDVVARIAEDLCLDLFRPYVDDSIRHPLDELRRLLPGERVLDLLRKRGGEDFERFFQAHHGDDVRTRASGLEEKWAALECDKDDPGAALTSKDYVDRSNALKLEHRQIEDRVYGAAINRMMAGYGTGWPSSSAGAPGRAPS